MIVLRGNQPASMAPSASPYTVSPWAPWNSGQTSVDDGWFGRELSPFTPVTARLTHASLSASIECSNLGGAARWESLLFAPSSVDPLVTSPLSSPVLPSAGHSTIEILAQSGKQKYFEQQNDCHRMHDMQAGTNDQLYVESAATLQELKLFQQANALLDAQVQEMSQSLDTLQARLADTGIERERAKASVFHQRHSSLQSQCEQEHQQYMELQKQVARLQRQIVQLRLDHAQESARAGALELQLNEKNTLVDSVMEVRKSM